MSARDSYLLGGRRFKFSFIDHECPQCSEYVGKFPQCLEGFEKELDQRWVAFVPAEDDQHLNVASPKDWRMEASAWLRRKADEQERTNREFPKHVEAYPSWVDRPRQFRWLAIDLEQEASKAMGVAK